ncbi:MAG: extracellular solute-binding protein [Candidatus Muiribacteriaceae bacterium]
MKIQAIIILCFSVFLLSCDFQEEELSLELLLSMSGDNSEMISLAKEFETLHNIRVDISKVPFFSLKPLLLSETEKKFDVVLGVADWAGELSKKGIIRDIPYKSDRHTDYLQIDGKIKGIIQNYEHPMFFYYADRFDVRPGNIAQIFEHLGKGFMYDTGNMYYNMFLACFFGNGFLDEKSYDLAHPDFISYLEFIDKYRENVPESVNYDAVVNLFTAGELDIILDGSWNHSRHISNGASVLPIVPDSFFAGAKVFYICSDQLRQSRKLIDFLLKGQADKTSPTGIVFQEDMMIIPDFDGMKEFWNKGNELFYRLFSDNSDINSILKKVLNEE